MKEKVEYRYYEVPQNFPLIALLGERWITQYGRDPMHFHNCMEIGYCYFGEGTMYFGEKEMAYHAGTMTFIPQNFLHHTKGAGEEDNRWEYLFIDADKFLKERFANRSGYAKKLLEILNGRMLLLEEKEHPEIAALLHFILEEMRAKEELYHSSVEGLVQSLLFHIIRVHSRISETLVASEKVFKVDSIGNALDYVEKNFASDFKVEELARICNMSETHFRRIFGEYMHISPMEYVNLVRVEKACDILVRTEESIDSIARKTGFPVPSTFMRNFKKIVGKTPHQWRNSARERPDNVVNYDVSIRKGW